MRTTGGGSGQPYSAYSSHSALSNFDRECQIEASKRLESDMEAFLSYQERNARETQELHKIYVADRRAKEAEKSKERAFLGDSRFPLRQQLTALRSDGNANTNATSRTLLKPKHAQKSPGDGNSATRNVSCIPSNARESQHKMPSHHQPLKRENHEAPTSNVKPLSVEQQNMHVGNGDSPSQLPSVNAVGASLVSRPQSLYSHTIPPWNIVSSNSNIPPMSQSSTLHGFNSHYTSYPDSYIHSYNIPVQSFYQQNNSPGFNGYVPFSAYPVAQGSMMCNDHRLSNSSSLIPSFPPQNYPPLSDEDLSHYLGPSPFQ